MEALHYFLRKRRFSEAIAGLSENRTGYASQETLQFWTAAALVLQGGL